MTTKPRLPVIEPRGVHVELADPPIQSVGLDQYRNSQPLHLLDAT